MMNGYKEITVDYFLNLDDEYLVGIKFVTNDKYSMNKMSFEITDVSKSIIDFINIDMPNKIYKCRINPFKKDIKYNCKHIYNIYMPIKPDKEVGCDCGSHHTSFPNHHLNFCSTRGK